MERASIPATVVGWSVDPHHTITIRTDTGGDRVTISVQNVFDYPIKSSIILYVEMRLCEEPIKERQDAV